MEHLFKLKKDGKTVGYMRIERRGGNFRSKDLIVRYSVFGKKWDGRVTTIQWFDEALPFVCKDKNSKDVFAGDKALADLTELTGEKDIQEVDAVVRGGFDFWDIEGHTFVEASEAGDIELIE